MANRYERLEKELENFNDKVSKWFLFELAKWSRKHKTYIKHYGILKIWAIGSDDVYEPYHRYTNSDLDEKYADALRDYEDLVDKASCLGLRCWQGLEYSYDHKFIQ